MDYQTFKKIKIITTSFVAATVALAVVLNNITLSLAGVLIGLLFLMLVKRKTKTVLVDERIKVISGYAARLTYVILTALLGLLSLMFIMNGRRTADVHIEALGMVLSYITLLSVALYSISYKYFSKKYGGDADE